MIKSVKMLVALLVALSAWLDMDISWAANAAGEVLAISGSCDLLTPSPTGVRQPLKRGDVVHVGDTVEVAATGRLKLHMADGSVLSLAGGTTLTIASYAADPTLSQRDARLQVSSGLLHAVVSTMAAPSRFEVEGATAVAAVRSTDWFIESRPTLVKIGVVSGAVALSSKATGHAVEVAKGYGAKVEGQTDPTTPRFWPAAEFEEYRLLTDLP